MNRPSKKYLIATIICVVLTFVWIFVTVLITGGRETDAFTKEDTAIFIMFIVSEAVTLFLAFFFANKHNKLNRRATLPLTFSKKTKSEKIMVKRGILLNVSALLCALLGEILGIIIASKADFHASSAVAVFICGLVAAVIMLLYNIIAEKKFVNKLNSKKVIDMQQYIVSHRETAEKTSEEKLVILKRLRRRTDCFAGVLCVISFAMSVSGGMLFDTASTLVCFGCAFLYLAAFSRIRFAVPDAVFDDDELYVDEKDFPEIYALARTAAKTLGCAEKIRIAFLDNCNAGIAKIGNYYSVQLGVILLNTFTRDELYNVLLHEFAHMSSETKESEKEGKYMSWLLTGGNEHSASALTSKFFCWFDTVYNFEYSLYKFAVSILKETEADRQMVLKGDAKAAASGLLKLKYYEFFEWEKGTQDEECFFESEQLQKDLLKKETEQFKKAVKERAKVWNGMVDVEILSRRASHPTLKMRLEAFGISDVGTLEPEFVEPGQEMKKALDFVEELIYKKYVDSYEEDRKNCYIEPKQQVEQWENAGRPIVAAEYSDIISALRMLGRVSEAKALCDRAIDELPETAALYAYFMKGQYLLRSYDESGIEYVYKAIENNSNYIDEGLAVIGEYCCLAGKQDQLEAHRERAVEISQKEKDLYSKINILQKGDSLAEEKLPDGMLEEILSYIKSVDKDAVDKVYLVRKTVSEDFFTSAFVVKFEKGADEEVEAEIMYKIFKYLDTCSDWQFSLFSYPDVSDAHVEQVKNSCVYDKRMAININSN